MTPRPYPLVFEPILKPKPWGGRSLETLLGKSLPPGEAIGESWELAGLPEGQSRIRNGPLAGRTLAEAVALWGGDLLGSATLIDGSFPLLIKFLDARENLSVQVHPWARAGKAGESDEATERRGEQGAESDEATGAGSAAVERASELATRDSRLAASPQLATPTPPIKHESWYVIAAEPGAVAYIGLRPGVSRADLAAAAGRAESVSLLRRWPVRKGDCFYLPSGTPHALGAGVVVAEIQTPSDVTYRLYDWERRDAAGNPRMLHLADALRHVRDDVGPDQIAQPRSHACGALLSSTRLVRCEAFRLDRLTISEGVESARPDNEMAVWIILAGGGEWVTAAQRLRFGPGDVLLLPAAAQSTFRTTADSVLLEAHISIYSKYLPIAHPAPGAAGAPVTPLTRGGRAL